MKKFSGLVFMIIFLSAVFKTSIPHCVQPEHGINTNQQLLTLILALEQYTWARFNAEPEAWKKFPVKEGQNSVENTGNTGNGSSGLQEIPPKRMNISGVPVNVSQHVSMVPSAPSSMVRVNFSTTPNFIWWEMDEIALDEKWTQAKVRIKYTSIYIPQVPVQVTGLENTWVDTTIWEFEAGEWGISEPATKALSISGHETTLKEKNIYIKSFTKNELVKNMIKQISTSLDDQKAVDRYIGAALYLDPKLTVTTLRATTLYARTKKMLLMSLQKHELRLLGLPPCYTPWVRLGELYELVNLPDQAIKAYQKAHHTRSDEAEPIVALSNLYVQSNDLQNAMHYFMRAGDLGGYLRTQYPLMFTSVIGSYTVDCDNLSAEDYVKLCVYFVNKRDWSNAAYTIKKAYICESGDSIRFNIQRPPAMLTLIDSIPGVCCSHMKEVTMEEVKRILRILEVDFHYHGEVIGDAHIYMPYVIKVVCASELLKGIRLYGNLAYLEVDRGILHHGGRGLAVYTVDAKTGRFEDKRNFPSIANMGQNLEHYFTTFDHNLLVIMSIRDMPSLPSHLRNFFKRQGFVVASGYKNKHSYVGIGIKKNGKYATIERMANAPVSLHVGGANLETGKTSQDIINTLETSAARTKRVQVYASGKENSSQIVIISP